MKCIYAPGLCIFTSITEFSLFLAGGNRLLDISLALACAWLGLGWVLYELKLGREGKVGI